MQCNAAWLFCEYPRLCYFSEKIKMKKIALLLNLIFALISTSHSLTGQTVQFLEGSWEKLNSCARCEPCNDQMSDKEEFSKSVKFYQDETLIDEWFLIKQELTGCEQTAFRTLSKSGYNTRGSAFEKKEDALLDIYLEVREKYPSGNEIRWMESPHTELALHTIQHFFDPIPPTVQQEPEPETQETQEATQEIIWKKIEPETNTREVFKVVEQMPVFKSEACEGLPSFAEQKACGDRKMLEFIYRNVKYPAEAQEQKIEGTVIVQFVVNTEGYLEDINVTRDIGGGCGEAAKKVVELMNEGPQPWQPGTQGGKKVFVQFNLPIKFKL